jgi:dihydropyrimidinase
MFMAYPSVLMVEEYGRLNFDAAKFVITPPLHTHKCQHELWRGLRFDDLQIVYTDQCPFYFNEQSFGIQKSKQMGRDNSISAWTTDC